MKETLIEIKEAIDLLNQLSDDCNKLFAQLNQLFQKWGVGVEAEYTMSDGRSFCFGRVKDKFRFHIKENNDSEAILIENLPRFVRLELMARLPSLLNLILNRIREQIETIPKNDIIECLNEFGNFLERKHS